jgi:hypothetical protein
MPSKARHHSSATRERRGTQPSGEASVEYREAPIPLQSPREYRKTIAFGCTVAVALSSGTEDVCHHHASVREVTGVGVLPHLGISPFLPTSYRETFFGKQRATIYRGHRDVSA